MTQLQLREHAEVQLGQHTDLKDLLLNLIATTGGTGQQLDDVRLMGMEYDAPYGRFVMSYYVGTDWIDKRKGISMVVRPKIESLDFQEMLMKCFSCPKASENLDEVLYIRTEDEPIEVDARDFQLEPLLIVFFLNLMQKIVRKGLRHDYIMREERLDGKIKGKVLMNEYARKGIAKGRKDQVNCRFQEYAVDCLDNRVLKTALLLCRDIINRNRIGLSHQIDELDNMYNNAIVAFEQVEAGVSLQDLHRVHVHPMYKDYRAIMPLAKMIIRKQGYCVGEEYDEEVNRTQKFPPFIINMPILFERYVYSLLVERYGDNNIGYQVATHGNIMDFTKQDEHMIMDTKYKPQWEDGVDHDNARQLSGYARHLRLREKLEVYDSDYICPCVIIYPDVGGVEDFKDAPDKWLDEDNSPQDPNIHVIPQYLKFYKVAIKLPTR